MIWDSSGHRKRSVELLQEHQSGQLVREGDAPERELQAAAPDELGIEADIAPDVEHDRVRPFGAPGLDLAVEAF